MKVYGIAVGVAAVAAAGQLWLARWARVLAPDEAFHPAYATWGNDVWPIQLVVLVWCVSSAAVLGVAAAGGKPVAAALGALALSFVVVDGVPAHARVAAAMALVLGAVIGGDDGSPDRLGGGLVAWLSVAVVGAAAAALIRAAQVRGGRPAAV